MDDQDTTQQKLQDWLKGVTNNLQEVRVLKTWVQYPLCLKGNVKETVRLSKIP